MGDPNMRTTRHEPSEYSKGFSAGYERGKLAANTDKIVAAIQTVVPFPTRKIGQPENKDQAGFYGYSHEQEIEDWVKKCKQIASKF